jgi:hypothetical protein
MVVVTKGIETTKNNRTRLKKTSTRSTDANVRNSPWWLTQMMPMVKKLIA